ncbi:MAG: hypothetical protein HWE10_13840, partial [Gammaproteobacteria bacterium]|nr:hypothetical protein [Gammaproteobacteria bacterium]
MSVINKMLKDLEQRQEPEHNNGHEGTSATFVPTQDKKQTGLVIVLTSVIVFLLIAFAWFYINNKNSAEKNTSIIQPTASAPATPAALKLENQAPEQTPNTIELATDATELATNSNTPITQPQLTAEKKAVSTHEKVT